MTVLITLIGPIDNENISEDDLVDLSFGIGEFKKEEFKNYDTNGDGYIDMQELTKNFNEWGLMTAFGDELLQLVTDLDVDGDGKVNPVEYEHLIEQTMTLIDLYMQASGI